MKNYFAQNLNFTELGVKCTFLETFNPGCCDARLPRSGGIPYIFKACEKSPFAGFVPQSGITARMFLNIDLFINNYLARSL